MPFAELATHPQGGDLRCRVQRGVIVKVKGKAGEWFVTLRDSPYIYAKPWDGEKQTSRATRQRQGEFGAKSADKYADGAKRFHARDITHVKVGDRPRRRRRRY